MKQIVIVALLCIFSTSLNASSLPEMEGLAGTNRDYRLYYNIALEYLKISNTGEAILNLKRAATLEPGDKDTLDLLYKERAELGYPRYFFEPTPLEAVLLFPFSFMSINASAVLGFVCFILGAALLSLRLGKVLEGSVRPEWKLLLTEKQNKQLRTATMALLLIGTVYLAVAGVRYAAAFDRAHAVVIIPSALQELPEVTGLKILEIPAGTEGRISKEISGYYLLRTIAGKEGWIPVTAVERLWKDYR